MEVKKRAEIKGQRAKVKGQKSKGKSQRAKGKSQRPKVEVKVRLSGYSSKPLN